MNEIQQVWVAYAAQDQQFHIAVPFQPGLTALAAIEQSGIATQVQLPEPLALGIFGVRLKNLHQLLQVGDRVEIYRPLTINPKDIRRKRAAENPVGRYCRGNRFKQLK
ncbi:RnfH family protein [Acinetobacter bouvetii]|uniref:UPF0125 protein SFB21_0714 n=1 Tax=Acinetobacter bouvetii TaxID=202951 RepID=A0A811G941_9GAMM|nr:RnfH family protein [Acinetobacter bouvetii]CAB1210029.1 Persistence and stress-resistance antitoxin PasI [Acinetobacter bouvetii]